MSGLINRRGFVSMLLLCALVLLTVPTLAQDNVLQPGEPVVGVIDDNTPAQIYTFTTNAAASINLELTAPAGLSLTMLLSDASGAVLAQAVNAPISADLPQAGTFYVTLFVSAGVETAASGSFGLILDVAETTTAPTTAPATADVTEDESEAIPPVPDTAAEATFRQGQVNLLNGIQVDLIWNTQDDLNLQVRAPSGETLYWNSRTTSDGGTFGPDINGLCEILAEPPAVETASWSGGPLAFGSYELLIYYRQSCVGVNPVDFTVEVTVDGAQLEPIRGTLQPPTDGFATVFISSFTVNEDGTASTGLAGPYTDTLVLPVPAAELLALDATPVIPNQPMEGFITNEQPWQTFTLPAEAGQVVNIEMTATVGYLDTLVLIMDSSGNVIAGNDDIEPVVNTDSAVMGLRLPVADTYTIVATRYGKDVGGTAGFYELLVTTGAIAEQQVIEFDLPDGDIEVTLTWDTNADLRLLVRDPFGSSVYSDSAVVQSGGRLGATGNLNCTPTDEVPVFYIYWPPGQLRIGTYEVEVWYLSECGDTRPTTFSLFVVANGQLAYADTAFIGFRDHYLTSFTIAQDGRVSGGPGGMMGGSETLDISTKLPSAVTITSGQTITGSITQDDKFDVYVFDGQPGDVVTVAMNATSGTLDPLLFVLDPNGVEIAENDDADAGTINSLITGLTLGQSGQYVIIATHFGTIYGGTTGGYELTLRIDR